LLLEDLGLLFSARDEGRRSEAEGVASGESTEAPTDKDEVSKAEGSIEFIAIGEEMGEWRKEGDGE
jgi:hypothetical protein